MSDTTVVSVEDMRDYLRIDGTANDKLIAAYLESAATYIERATGLTTADQANDPLAKSATRMLVAMWYDPQGIDATASERAAVEMLKHIQPSKAAQDNG